MPVNIFNSAAIKKFYFFVLHSDHVSPSVRAIQCILVEDLVRCFLNQDHQLSLIVENLNTHGMKSAAQIFCLAKTIPHYFLEPIVAIHPIQHCKSKNQMPIVWAWWSAVHCINVGHPLHNWWLVQTLSNPQQKCTGMVATKECVQQNWDAINTLVKNWFVANFHLIKNWCGETTQGSIDMEVGPSWMLLH